MLARRRVELRAGAPGLSQTLISRESLHDCGRAEAVLANAQAQADALLQEAQAMRTALLAEAQAQFWECAQAQLDRWERERQDMWSGLERNARTLVNLALQRLLDDTPAPRRLKALLGQLARSQSSPVSARLHCHPDTLQAAQHWLDEREQCRWSLQPDERLERDELRLITEEGDFLIDWQAASQALLLAEEPAPPG